MANTYPVVPPFETFRGIDGTPLEAGFIYIGTANLDPVANPVTVYWDSAGTITAAQPIRTVNGYPSRGGSPAAVYVASDYSTLVTDKKGQLIYSAPTSSDLMVQLAGPTGATRIGYLAPFTGAQLRTQASKDSDIVSVMDFGAYNDGTHKAETSAAFAAAIAAMVTRGGGRIDVPDGTYLANVNLSKLGTSAWVEMVGVGYDTIIQSDTGIVLDLSGSSYLAIRDLQVKALTGAEVAILASRYSGFPNNGGGIDMRRVMTTGDPSVCGLMHIGAEVSYYSQCRFGTGGTVPQVLVSSNNDLNYVSPNGTILEPVSQFTTRFSECIMVKDSGTPSPLIQIGGGVYVLEFHHCYFNTLPGRGCIELNGASKSDRNIRNLVFNTCGFEANTVGAAEGAHGIFCVAAGGTVVVSYLTVENCFFRQIRNAAGYYDMGGFSVYNANIRNNKAVFGGGLNLVNVSGGHIEWDGASASLKAAITATDTSFQLTHGAHNVQVGDQVAVGLSKRTAAATGTTYTEVKTVTTVTLAAGGDTISIAPATFAYNHPISDVVQYSLPTATTSQSTEWVVPAWPFNIGSDLGNTIITNYPDMDYREYVGPPVAGAITNTQAPIRIHRPFVNQPNNPQNGMFGSCRFGSDWVAASTSDLNGWTISNFPFWYSTRFYGIPLCIPNSAVYDPPSIAPGASATTTVTVTGAVLGDYAQASFSKDLLGMVISAYVSSANTVTVVLFNPTAGAVDLVSGTLRALVTKA